MKINWNDKISYMREISNELNIGLDSMIFFDDDPINCELMRIHLPEVYTINLPRDPSEYPRILQDINDFNIWNITDEDIKRNEMYYQQRKRTELKREYRDISEYLSDLDIRVKIKKADDFTIPRISQLTLKTNQFNLTTKRYQEEDIRKFAQDKNKIVECTQVEDKFGDNGITGTYIIDKENNEEWILDSFLLSCRIMGRGVENGMLGHIIEEAKKSGIGKIKAKFIPTTKNRPAEEFLPNFGFRKEGEFWIYDVNENVKIPKHLKIIVE